MATLASARAHWRRTLMRRLDPQTAVRITYRLDGGEERIWGPGYILTLSDPNFVVVTTDPPGRLQRFGSPLCRWDQYVGEELV